MFRKPNQLVGYVFGATFILLGVLGFPVTGGHSFAGPDGGQLLGMFGVNTLHNIVHLTAGAVLILGAVAGEAVASRVNATLGAFYVVAATVGLLIGGGPLNLLALNLADNLVHLANGIVLLGVGVAGLRAARRRTPVAAGQHGR
jgi:hypothetical protein